MFFNLILSEFLFICKTIIEHKMFTFIYKPKNIVLQKE